MALLDFPTGPQLNDTTTQNGNTWKWNGTSWVAFNNLSLSSQVTGVLGTPYGGTGKSLSSLTVGSILYADSSSSFAALAPSTANYVLATQGAGSPPYWKVDDSGTGSVGSGITGGFAYYTGLNTITSGVGYSWISGSGNAGTVILTNSAMALIGSTITAGTWNGNVIGVPYGGTGLNAISAGQIIYGSGSNTYGTLNHPGAGYALTSVGSTVAWQQLSVMTVGFAGSATTATTAGSAFTSSWVSTDASTGTRYLIGTLLNTASAGGTTLSTGSGITIGNNRITATTFAGNATTATTAGSAGIATTATTAGSAFTSSWISTDASTGTRYLVGTLLNTASAGGTTLSTGSGITIGNDRITATTFAGNATTATTAGSAGVATTATTAGSAFTSSWISTDASTGTRYLVGTLLNTASSGGTTLSTGSGITIGNDRITATTFSGTATNATNATNTAITDDTSTSSAQYVTWVGGASGNQAQKVTSTKLTFTPSSGVLSATTFSGSGANLTNVVYSVTSGDANRITVTASTGGTGAVTVNLPNTVIVNDVQLQGGSSTLTTVGSNPTSMVNKQYVDNLASGLDIHASVRVVQVSSIGASYVQTQAAGSAATGSYLISTTQVALPAIDGVTFVATGTTQRLLIAGGATGRTSINGSAFTVTPSNPALVNGIYYVGALGGAGTSNWILVRATDTDDNTELTAGTFTFVEEGDIYKDTGWVCTNDTTNLGPIQFGLDNATTGVINFTQFTGAAALTIGQGLSRVGNTIATKANIDWYGPLTNLTTGSGGAGYSSFSLGGFASGSAGTSFSATLRVGTATTYGSGTAAVVLNTTGFSMTGGTQTTKSLTITDDITLSGGNNTLTLSGNITLPNPGGAGRIAYSSDNNTVAFQSGTSGQILQSNGTSAPTFVNQSSLFVGIASTAGWATTAGGATTAGSLQGGSAGNIVYQSAANTSGFITNAAGTGFSVLTQDGSQNTAPVYKAQSQLSVGSAGSATTANTAGSAFTSSWISTDASSGTRFLIGTLLNTASAGGTTLSTGSGITIGNNLLTSLNLVASGTTASTSTTTGALVVAGGVGIGGSLWTSVNNFSSISGVGHSNSTITSGSWAGNAITLAYGGTNGTNSGTAISNQLAVYNNAGNAITQILSSSSTGNSILLQASQNVVPQWVSQSTLLVGSATTAAAIVTDASIGTRFLVGTLLNTGTANTTLSTGSGITIGNNLLTSLNLVASGTTAATSTSTGALVVAGGVGIGGSIWTSANNFASISGLGISNGQVTSGVWGGFAVSLVNGGTGNNVSGTGHSNKVAVYNTAGTAITSLILNQGNIIFGATGGTYAGIASTLLPVTAISDNPPAQPGGAIGSTQAGQLWWDSQYGVLKVYYNDGNTSQWVDATPVLGSSGGGSSVKRSYVMTFGAGFTPSVGADSVQIQVPYAPDNTTKYYYIKRLDYRNETVSGATGASFYIDRHTSGNAAFSVTNRIHTAGAGAASSFVIGSSAYTASWTLAASGASFVSSSGVAASVISGDYLRLNFTTVNSAATLSVSMIIEEQ